MCQHTIGLQQVVGVRTAVWDHKGKDLILERSGRPPDRN